MSRSPQPRRCPGRTGSSSVTTARSRSAREGQLVKGDGGVRILVTGGAGFIGSHYVRTMLSGGYPGYEDASVTVLDALTYAGNRANLAPVADRPRLRFVRGDITDSGLARTIVPGHDAVINFAAETHVDRAIDQAAPFVATNVAGR